MGVDVFDNESLETLRLALKAHLVGLLKRFFSAPSVLQSQCHGDHRARSHAGRAVKQHGARQLSEFGAERVHVILMQTFHGERKMEIDEAQARRRGVARQLMEAMIAWCRQQGDVWRVVLRASPDGRALYEDLGFRPTNHLQLDLGLDSRAQQSP